MNDPVYDRMIADLRAGRVPDVMLDQHVIQEAVDRVRQTAGTELDITDADQVATLLGELPVFEQCYFLGWMIAVVSLTVLEECGVHGVIEEVYQVSDTLGRVGVTLAVDRRIDRTVSRSVQLALEGELKAFGLYGRVSEPRQGSTAEVSVQVDIIPKARRLPYPDFVAQYRAGALHVEIPEEVVEELVINRKLSVPPPELRRFVVRRTGGAIGWVGGLLAMIADQYLLGIVLFIIGLWLFFGADRDAKGYVVEALLGDEELYEGLARQHLVWISRVNHESTAE